MNVVLCLLDDAHFDVFARMPWFGTLDSGGWVIFDTCVEEWSQCGPSRTTIATGQFARHHGVTQNALGAPGGPDLFDSSAKIAETLPVHLRRAGVRAAIIGKYMNGFPFARANSYIPPGWDVFKCYVNGQDYVGYSLNENGAVNAYGAADTWTGVGAAASATRTGATDYSTDRFSQLAQNFINASTKEPFYLEIAFNAPHGPRDPAARHAGMFAGQSDLATRGNFNPPAGPLWDKKPAWLHAASPVPLTAAEIAAEKADQEDAWCCVQSVDEAMADLVAKLKTFGYFDRTVILFIGDNGFCRGEHRWIGKNCAYDASILTQLWVRHPALAPANRVDHAIVSMLDLNPTIREIFSARPWVPPDGQSMLRRILNPAEPWRTHAFCEWVNNVDVPEVPSFTCVRTPTAKYIENSALASIGAAAEQELYDLTVDPWENDNVITAPAYAGLRADLAERVRQVKAQ